MAHRDFDAARRAHQVDRDPVTFTLGGETFEVVLTPSLGDTFDLADAPPVRIGADGRPQFDADSPDDLTLVRVLTRFLQRSLPLDERAKFDRALYRIPSHDAGVIIEAAVYVTEQMTAHPSGPPGSSSSGRHTTGPTSNSESVGGSPSS